MKYLIFLAVYAFAVAFAAEFTPDDFKKTSAQHRAAAAKNPKMYTADTGSGTPPTSVKEISTVPNPPGKDADHILERQTVARALNKGGVTKVKLGATLNTIIDIMNDSKNVVFVDSGINRSKGPIVESALNGGHSTPSALVKDYMQKVNPRALAAANAIDAALASAKITGVSVAGTHNNAMKNAGV